MSDFTAAASVAWTSLAQSGGVPNDAKHRQFQNRQCFTPGMRLC
jgi:hypothetical protein